jgi:hypothetical protein
MHIRKLQQVWLAVEEMREKLGPGSSARKACAELEKCGGIRMVRSGDQTLGVGATINWVLDKKDTINRRWKDGERLRKSDPDIDAFWQRALAQVLGLPHSPSPPWQTPWRPGWGKAEQK